jgi:hypothetical protein
LLQRKQPERKSHYRNTSQKAPAAKDGSALSPSACFGLRQQQNLLPPFNTAL